VELERSGKRSGAGRKWVSGNGAVSGGHRKRCFLGSRNALSVERLFLQLTLRSHALVAALTDIGVQNNIKDVNIKYDKIRSKPQLNQKIYKLNKYKEQLR
jgi:hypothetical protein